MKTWIYPFAALACIAAGCDGPDELGRRAISGTVTLDGKALASGSVTYVPTESGPAVGATIEDGRFSIDRESGPIPGAYRVEILAIRPTGRTIADPEGPKGSTVEERKNIVPDRYGSQSTLTSDVTPTGPNTFEYKLDSRPDPAARRRR